ncbi:hypothetical protein QA641_15270 [Bradyrhizobium sp. CB1650]|uniref:hypothetical protein n=1 Tax=Bradyrhizobium sp. CB1650 TaxID=3039153 RepID=UPI0024351016|nr:hypothetical protein [Bradyrhizobium sp. CB1650]WGD56920.1 hypothetical protein QA641_15270 [Bradyrhizobium sp. CB1650]
MKFTAGRLYADAEKAGPERKDHFDLIGVRSTPDFRAAGEEGCRMSGGERTRQGNDARRRPCAFRGSSLGA